MTPSILRCARNGCKKEYLEDRNELCIFHPGAPVFHEGLKSWSCCSDVNKPVLDFDEFMGIPGCTETDGHSTYTPALQSSVSSDSKNPSAGSTLISGSQASDGKETFGISGIRQYQANPKPTQVNLPLVTEAPIVDDEDDLSVSVTPGASCLRRGCGVRYVSDEINRNGEGEGTICTYHPLQPIFREGSKGYLCCKRRVLEFDEFLKIKGCKLGRHLFVSRVSEHKVEEPVNCRIDHYQTLDKVQVSIFAKKVDKEQSVVKFEEEEVILDLHLPNSKRFTRSLNLFGPIDPSRSSFQVLGTKVDVSLQKKDNRSWTVLEKTDRDLGGISLTFGVGGRTGTVGAKEVILDESNLSRS